MTTDNAAYLQDLHNLLNQHFDQEEVKTLCFRLNVDHESISAQGKPAWIRQMLLLLGRQGRLPELVAMVQQERPNVSWPTIPSDFQLPAALASADTVQPAAYNNYGDVAGRDVKKQKIGVNIEGGQPVFNAPVVVRDQISAGDVSGSYNAIGAGAQVIVNQIQQALSAIDEMEKGIQAAERRLAAAIQQKIGRYANLTAPTQVDIRENPYKALLDYKLEDAPFFYGRSQAVQDMGQKMRNGRLTILHSESGSGKTSLLQAGLASRLLADGHFPLYLRPYRQSPDQFIKREFLPDYATLPELSRFRDDQTSLKGFLERVAYYLGDRQIYIFLDQFEEFFTEQSPEMQRAFAGQLQECVESDLPARWVLSLRKEYFSDLRLLGALRPFDNEYFLPTFRLEEAQEVVTEPAALKGVQYEAGLVDHILNDLCQEDKGIPPAQVQLVCYTLFDELPTAEEATLISHALYDKPRGRGAGEPGAKGILTSHLSRVLDRELKSAERRIANRILEELVTSDVRRAVRSRAQLASELETTDPATLEHVLTTLHENRLIRRDLDENDQPVYELTHDYLLSEIELNPETQARKAAQELLAQELAAYRQFKTLLSKDRFDIIHSQMAYLKLDETAQTLLQESEAALEAERLRELKQERALADAQRQRAEEAEQAAVKQSRLTRIAFAVGGIAVFLLVITGIFAVIAKNSAAVAIAESTRAAENLLIAEHERKQADRERTVAESRALAAQALTVVGDDPVLGLLLAIRANRTATTIEARRSLAKLLADRLWAEDDVVGSAFVGRALPESNLGGLGGSLGIDSEGKWIASNRNGFVVLWDLETGAFGILHEYREPANGLAFSLTEPILLFGGDKSILLKNLTEDVSSPPTLIVDTRANVEAIEFSRDGRFFAYTDRVDVAIWDIESLQQLSKPVDNGQKLQISGLSFDPTSDQLYGLSPGWGGSILRWDVQSGALIDTPFEFENDADLWSMVFHPNGQLLFTTFRRTYNNFMAWDMKTSLRLKDVFDYSYLNPTPATSFAFVESKEIMAVGYADGQIIIWDTVGLAPIIPPLQHAESTNIVRDIVFTPDTQALVSVSDEGPIIIWDLSAFEFGVEGMIQRACQIVDREMTLYEWHGFMGDDVSYERTCP